MGTYQVFSHDGTDIGGMMGLGNSPVPAWLPYFGTNGVEAAMERIKAAGGKVAHGPMEVPGGAFIAIAQDPQGAWFAVVGPKEVTRVTRPPAVSMKAIDLRHADAVADLRELERALAAHPARVAVHDLERGADVGREVDLVDDEEVGAGDARAALARDLVAGRRRR